MALYKLKLRSFTFYDETDNLKRMKDSDILAEQKKPISNTVNNLRAGATGAATGLAIGGALGGALGTSAAMKAAGKSGLRATTGVAESALKSAKKFGKAGALLAGVGAYALSANKSNKQMKENRAYNSRLAYAQNQAVRRERKDWKTNMTQRDGYSY